MPIGKRVAVIEAGQPDADSLASLFILLGYGDLSISSYLHQHGYDEKFIHNDWDFFSGDYLVFYPKACPPSVLQKELLDTSRTVHGIPRSRRKYDRSCTLITERLVDDVRQRDIDIGIATRKRIGIPNRVTQSRSHAVTHPPRDRVTA